MARNSFNSAGTGAGSSGPAFDLNFKQVIIALRERWLGALALALLAASLTGWIQLRKPPLYQATATLLYSPPNNALAADSNSNRLLRSRMGGFLALNLTAQISSVELAGLVYATLSDEEKEAIVAPYLSDDASVNREELYTEQRIVGMLRSSIRLQRLEELMSARLVARHRSPDVAAMIANRYAEQFLLMVASQNDSDSSSAVKFLEQQAEELRQKLEQTERDLQAYREDFNLVSLEEKQNVVLDRLKALSSSTTSARVERLSIETRLAQARALVESGGTAQEVAKLTSNGTLAATVSQLDQRQQEKTVLGQRYGRRHPRMLEISRQIEALTEMRDLQIQSAIIELENQLKNAIAQENELRAEMAKSEAENLNLDKIGVRYNVLRREVDTTRATYTQILTRLNETRISAQLDSDVFRFSERAYAQRTPIEPDRQKAILSAAMVGLILFFGYPLGMEVFASKVRSWSDVEGILQSSLLGEFGDFKKIPTQDRAHVMLKDVNDDAKEAFRALYSQLRLSSQIDAPKTILITSSVPSEGKSFIASNLAATFSTHKLRTLLIDGDLRRPVQHRSLGVSNAHGMLRWLEEGAEGAPDVKDPALGITEIAPNFEFLAAGGSSRNITELLDSNGRLVQLLNHLKTVYDIVIIDSPPAGVFPDSIALAESADELIFVTRFNTVTRQHARQVLDLLRKTGLSMPGVVLNGMPTGRGGALYYSSYGYNYHGYKYRSEYDSESKKA